MIKDLLSVMKTTVETWHSEDKTWFNCEFPDTPEGLVTRLAYHNYCGWHFIEGYKNPDTGLVLFVYDGGIEQNRMRNEVIEKLDTVFAAMQVGTGPFNSETLASLVDRISVLYIKICHLREDHDSRMSGVVAQTERLEKCASELMDDMVTGRRQIEVLQRFKTSGYV